MGNWVVNRKKSQQGFVKFLSKFAATDRGKFLENFPSSSTKSRRARIVFDFGSQISLLSRLIQGFFQCMQCTEPEV